MKSFLILALIALFTMDTLAIQTKQTLTPVAKPAQVAAPVVTTNSAVKTVVPAPVKPAVAKTITCIKGKTILKTTLKNCPKGYKVK